VNEGNASLAVRAGEAVDAGLGSDRGASSAVDAPELAGVAGGRSDDSLPAVCARRVETAADGEALPAPVAVARVDDLVTGRMGGAASAEGRAPTLPDAANFFRVDAAGAATAGAVTDVMAAGVAGRCAAVAGVGVDGAGADGAGVDGVRVAGVRADEVGDDAVETVLTLFTLDVLLDVLVAVLLARLTVSWLPAVADGTGVTGGPPGAVSAEARPLSRNRSSDTPPMSSNSATAPRLRVCRATARIIGSVRTRREALRPKRPERDPRGCITQRERGLPSHDRLPGKGRQTGCRAAHRARMKGLRQPQHRGVPQR